MANNQLRADDTRSGAAQAVAQKAYNFMWGQRQSMMVTESIIGAIGPSAAYMTEGIGEHLQVVDKGMSSNYMPDASIEQWQQNGNKYFDRDFTERLFNTIDAFIADRVAFSERVRAEDMQGASSEVLAELLAQHRSSLEDTLVFFATSSPGSTYHIEQRMREILENKLGDDPRVKDYFIALTTPAELDDTMHERIDFAELAQQREVSNDDLLSYAYRYPALFMNTYDEAEVLSFLRARLEEYRSSEALQHERETIEATLRGVAEKHEEVRQTIGDDELEYLGSIVQRAALGRYRLKHVWSGAEFAHLSLLNELARRLGVPLEDLIVAYRFTDIEVFLQDGTRLTEQEIADRRHGIVFHWIDGQLRSFFGQEGLTYASGLVAAQGDEAVESQEITGQVASRGSVRGRARVVFVEDLKQFVRDSENFEKGEILVTTMTSPIMIPLIAKAAGIVTDEGGIASHAAVSAREFGIPCIVGTKLGTKAIKTGDEIEVDAEQGVVRKL